MEANLCRTGMRPFGAVINRQVLPTDPTVAQGKRAQHVRYPVGR
jgi:hypothetical protein